MNTPRDDAQRLMAYSLYAQGKKAAAIARELERNFKNPKDASTIRRWISKEFRVRLEDRLGNFMEEMNVRMKKVEERRNNNSNGRRRYVSPSIIGMGSGGVVSVVMSVLYTLERFRGG